jgi:hypothetical protein
VSTASLWYDRHGPMGCAFYAQFCGAALGFLRAMNEVSSRVWIFFEAMAGRGNVTPEALIDGSGVSLDRLRDPAQRFDWDVLAAAAKRLEEAVGADALVELGAESVDLPAAEPLRRGVGKLLGVGAFYPALRRPRARCS